MQGKQRVGLTAMLKSTCEGVHLLLKLPALSLQPCKLAKNKLLHFFKNIFQGFLLDFKFLSYSL